MLETLLSDVINVLRITFLSGDWISIAIAAVSVIAAALMMTRGGQIGSMTLLALTFYVVGSLFRTFLSPPPAEVGARITGERAANTLESGLTQFYDMSAGGLLAYFIGFLLVILVIFVLKSLVRR